MILAIYCAGGLGREMIALARSINRWEAILFVDDVVEQREIAGAMVLRFSEAERHRGNIEFVIANGEPKAREMLYQKIKAADYPMTTLIGAGCYILPDTEIGEGCVLYSGGISTGVKIACNSLINANVIIGHDTVISEHCVVSANCFIGGFTHIDKLVYVAPGALIKDRVHVASQAIISLGAVVLRNVREKAIMVGNPAKRIGYNTLGKVFNIFDD